jgi:hypothetical protein
MKLFNIIIHLLITGVLVSAADDFQSYDGYKVFRVNTTGQFQSVKDKLAAISYSQWDRDAKHLDISLSPDQIAAFKTLGLEYSTMHEDLGASIAAESTVVESQLGQADNLTWFNSYHPYANHEQYFTKLQSSFPNNSELVSSGTSFQGRNIFGIHLWGAGGPGKPAILWHGTVHAREWITAMVSLLSCHTTFILTIPRSWNI